MAIHDIHARPDNIELERTRQNCGLPHPPASKISETNPGRLLKILVSLRAATETKQRLCCDLRPRRRRSEPGACQRVGIADDVVYARPTPVDQLIRWIEAEDAQEARAPRNRPSRKKQRGQYNHDSSFP